MLCEKMIYLLNNSMFGLNKFMHDIHGFFQICIQDSRNKSEKIYQFDHVFPSSKTNQQVRLKLYQPLLF